MMTQVLICLLTTISQLLDAERSNLVSVKKIWDYAPHNAFTDLIRFRNRWWCAFREAQSHRSHNGVVRVIMSEGGDCWKSATLLKQDGIDLRDPKLSITPNNYLMLIMGGSIYDSQGVYQTRSPRVAFSQDGYDWTEPRKLLAEDHWLWRVTWQGDWAWGVSKLGEGHDPRRCMLYRSQNAFDWEWITEFRLPNNIWNASETTLRLLSDGEMIALTRPHWIGTSRQPYTHWSWTKIEEDIGGPNFLQLPDGSLWASGRRTGENPTTILARMSRNSYKPVLTVPSGGDCSYPGLVWHDDLLWMSYYSSHEEKTSIYLAKVKIN